MDLTAALTGHFAAVTPLKPSVGTTLTYDNRVDLVPATYHWPLREVSGLTFVQRKAGNVHPGTGSGSFEYVDGTLVQDDTSGRCIGMGGGADTSVVSITSHADFNATAGAWFAVIQPDTLEKMQILTRWPDAAAEAGVWYFEMQNGGGLSAARRDGTNASRVVSTPSPFVSRGVPNLVGFSWGNAGLRLWHGATVVAAQPDPVTTNWGGAPNVPIRVGRWVTGIDGFDGLIAHVMFLNFEPTNADVANLVAMGPGLSLLTGATLASIEVGQSAVYSIRPYGHFTDTITSVNEVDADPPNINVTVSGEDFTVQGVALDAGETFRLSVTDGRGTTAPATFTVPVTAASGTETWRYVDGVDWDFDAGGSVAARTAIFQNIIATASAGPKEPGTGRGVIELIPGKTYVVSTTSGTINSNNAALRITSSTPNVEIRTQGTPAVGGNQAKIQFESWNGKSACRQLLLFLDNTSNVKIGWLTFDGNKASCGTSYADRTQWVSNHLYGFTPGVEGLRYDQAGNGAVSNIRVGGGSAIVLKELDIKNALTDGLAVVGSGQPSGGTPATNFLAEDCDCHHNRRMDWGVPAGPVGSLSLTWDQIIFKRVKGRFCGDEPGVMVGQSPGSSTDIEPLQVSQYGRGITIDQCEWRDGQGWTFDSEADPKGVTGFAGSRGLVSDTHGELSYFKIIDSIAADNTSHAFKLNTRDNANYTHCLFQNLVATGNTLDYINFNATSSSSTALLTDVQIINFNGARIEFGTNLESSGHSVTITKGSFNPTVVRNGKTNITVNGVLNP